MVKMLQVLRLSQAGFVLEAADTRLVIDAFLSSRPDRLVPSVQPESLRGIDAILATHEHRDHLDLAALPALAAASPDARVIVPAPIVDRVREVVDAGRIIAATVGGAIRAAGARIVPVPAKHGVTMADAYSFGQELSNGLYRYLGYVIELGGVAVYHAGDTIRYEGQADRLRALGVELALVPINGRTPEREARGFVGNMDHVDAADVASQAGCHALVPMHHDTIDGNTGSVAALRAYVAERHPDLAVVELVPFARISWPKDSQLA